MSVYHHINSFEDILSNDIAIQRSCLDELVKNINEIKEKAIYDFLNDSGSEDFLWSLIKLLSSDDLRLASNAAYVIGSFAETELGSKRVLSIAEERKLPRIIQDLTTMLTSNDSETVMNAAGALGTLAETNNGRSWMLNQACINETMSRITDLLNYENNWVASNAALVLARLSISEDGCQKLLSHEHSSHILTKLIHSLGNDSAGRGMNAAFAIGRLMDTAKGKERLLDLPDTEKMVSALCRMLCKGDMGSGKNACFAVSCLAADKEGNRKVIANNLFNDILSRLVVLLGNDEDLEAAWFAAMTLRSLSNQQRGILRLRDNEMVLTALNKNLNKPDNTKELNDEITKTLEHLKKLDPPDPPMVSVLGPTSVRVKWREVLLRTSNSVVYKLFEGSKLVYKGKETQVVFDDLKPNTSYNYKLKVSAIGDDSPFSKVVTRVTGDKFAQHTTETSFIATKLQPGTSYCIHVRALTNKGEGETASVEGRTHELGAHAPGKPTVTVIGRSEVHVTWNSPAVPLGRISRYELIANKDVIYSGTDRSYYATNLVPDKDYSFTVCAITNEGRCESDVTRKRTHKDKSQIEPGRHASKTRSFKAKEFHLEKSKTQSSIVMQKHKLKAKKRPNSPPPNSCSSSSPHNLIHVNSHQDGSRAVNSASASSNIAAISEQPPEVGKQLTARPENHSIEAQVSVNGFNQSDVEGGSSMFLPKSHNELPLPLKLAERSSSTQNKRTIEPLSWNEISIVGSGPIQADNALKNIGIPKVTTKSLNKLKTIVNEKYLGTSVSQTKSFKTALPRMTAMDQHYMTSHRLRGPRHHGLQRNRRIVHKNRNSDTSSDDTPIGPIPPVKDAMAQNRLFKNDRKFLFDDPKQIAERIKSSDGYWSDNKFSVLSKEKGNEINLTHLPTFKHRSLKPFHAEWPTISEQWFLNASSNRKKCFFPTQTRTQRSNLPQSVLRDRRMDIFLPNNFRQKSIKKINQQRPSSFRHVTAKLPIEVAASESTNTNMLNGNSSKFFSENFYHSSYFNTKMKNDDLQEYFSDNDVIATSRGDPV